MSDRIVVTAVLAISFLLAGCSGSDTDKPNDTGVDVTGGDLQIDGLDPDEGIDAVEPDLGVDSVVDSVVDAAPDSVPDVMVDAPEDVAADLAADTLVLDSVADATPDALADVATTDASQPNATCASPTAVQLGGTPAVVTGDTTGAVNEFGGSITCGYYTFNGPQLYYEVSLSAGRGYRFELTPSGWDAGLYLFDDTTCDPATISSQCDVNMVDANSSGGAETLVVAPSTSATYIVAVDSTLTGANGYGPFTLTIEQFALPTNSICAQPEPIILQAGQTTTIQNDTSGAVNEFGSSINCAFLPFQGPQLYYKANLVAGKAYRFKLSAAWDSALYAFTDATCDPATIESQCSMLVADGGYTGDDETLIIAPSTTQDYILAVDAAFANHSGAFTLTIDEVVPPANNKCSTAESLTFAGNVATANGDTSSAANDAALSNSACGGNLAGTTGGDVFYSVTLNAGTTYSIDVQPDSLYDVAVYLFTDCADPETSCEGGEDTEMDGDMETITFTPTSTQTYLIGVDAWSGTEYGTFTLTVSH